MNEPGRFLLVFTIGPVQVFIAQARKTRDLWIGSLLLAKLMEAAMKDLPKDSFIFPYEQSVGEIPDIPNKYIATFESLDDARDRAAQSQLQIKLEWRSICNKVWQEFLGKQNAEETRKIWIRQTGVDPQYDSTSDPKAEKVKLDALFEVYWAIVDRDEKQQYQDVYGNWLEEAERRLAARKRLRDFFPGSEPGEKSAISGEREVLRGPGNSSKDILTFWKKFASAGSLSPKDIDKEGKEHLDAIDTVKRFAMQANAIPEKPFPSTSSIATASFVERLGQAATEGLNQAASEKLSELIWALEAWEKITDHKLRSTARDTAKDIPYLAPKISHPYYKWLLRRDGDLYFTETFVPRRLEENYNVEPESEGRDLAREGSRALKALLRATDALGITRPTPYYAALQMDGDNMGILLSKVKARQEHTALSCALSHFARVTAVEVVEKSYPARLVYAGGDDVLALAPLARDSVAKHEPRHVLALADLLQSRYQAEVKAVLSDSQNPEDLKRRKGVTASAGIVIAHHLAPLSYVLRSAREAEATAKNRYGRDALVVTLIRRSGEQTRVGCHWRYDDLEEGGQPLPLFARFYELFKEDILSPKCVYTLLEEAPALVNINAGLDATTQPNALQSEIKRVLKRQWNPKYIDEHTNDLVDLYAGYLTQLAAAMDAAEDPKSEARSVELHTNGRRYGLVEVLGWLLVMAFLTRKELE